MVDIKRYKWKNRILLVQTPSYKDKRYLETKRIFQDNMYEFHKRFVKFITNQGDNLKFGIGLVGFDGEIKHVYKKLNPQKVFKDIEDMPMGDLRKDINPTNLSLYSNDNPDKNVKKLGYKDKEKATYTLDKIKNKPLNYQVKVVSTMLGRAKNHPNKTKDMDAAIKVYERWLLNYHRKKDTKY